VEALPKSSPRFSRFSLRALLAGIAVLSALLTVLTTAVIPWYRDFRVGVSLKQFGADITTEPRGQYLFRQFAGDALSERAIYVHLSDPRINDEWLAQIAPLKHIELLSIKSPNVTDQGLVHLRHLSNLQTLHLSDTQVSTEGVEELREWLPNLRRVSGANSPK
jgi:hypothetical protein